ncbi:MAG: PAS domain S-box protein [Inhella sp.]|uniref:PAS domain S-box protein n=2 Tax=Inhella sp. TaxID=1921806 RepID=UPI003918B2AC
MDTHKEFFEAREHLRWRATLALLAITTGIMLVLGPLSAAMGHSVAALLAGITAGVGALLFLLVMGLPKPLGVHVAGATMGLYTVIAIAMGSIQGHSVHHWAYLFPAQMVFLLRPRRAALAMGGLGLYALLASAHLLSQIEILRFACIYLLLCGLVTTFALAEEQAGLALVRQSDDVRQFEQLLDASLDAIFTLDAEGRVSAWNDSAERILGWTADEMLGQKLSERIIPLRFREAHEARMKSVLASGQSRGSDRVLEMSVVHRDGHEFPVELSLWHVDTPRGPLFGALLRDIGARKETERQLREQETKYRSIVENGTEGILIVGGSRVIYANAFLERCLNRTLEELRGAPFTHFIHPGDVERVVENHRRRLAGEPAEQRYTFRILGADGRVVWVELSAVAIEWEGKAATLSFLGDVTQRHELEEKLLAKTREQEVMLQSTVIGIGLIASRQLRWANSTLEALFGYPPGALQGQPVALLFRSETDFNAVLPSVLATLDAEGRYAGELELRRADSKPIWVQVHGSRMPASDGGITSLWTFVDITERKRAEEELLNALTREREFGQMKSRFVATTSHEFRTPLAGILSSIDLIATYGERLDREEKDEMFRQIRDAVTRMTRMLDDILLIGRGDAQSIRFTPAATDLTDLCAQIRNEAAQSRPDGEGRPRILLDLAEVDGLWHLDAKLLRHLLGNLLSNALKYSPEGGDVQLRVRAADEGLRFDVVDQGIGIPEADQKRLFESFHRASNVGNISGTGLGLAIVKQSVELHGGRIEVHSTLGVGTTFTVYIPSRRAA